MDTTSHERRGIRRALGAIALEILVGFVGVFAAFWLADYQDRREVERQRAQVRAALLEEIRDIKRGTGNAAKGTGLWLAAFDSATKAGGRPPLEPMMTGEHFDTHMWEATLQGGGLQLLDVPTFYRLSAYYNDLARGFEELDRLRARSETILLPNVDKGPDEFYAAPGRLRVKYVWYPQGMRRVHQIALDVNRQSDSLIALLGRPGRP